MPGLISFGRETPYEKVATVPQARAVLEYTMSRDDAIVLMAREESVLAGFVCANIEAHALMPNLPTVKEWALWIRPAYRGGGLLRKFIRTLKDWGREHGAVGIQIGTMRKGHGTVKCIETAYWMEI